MASNILMILVSWVHILTVVIWGGGAVFLTFVLTPKLSILPPQEAGKLAGAISKQFTKIGLASIVIVAATGIFRMYLGGILSLNFLLTGSYGRMLLLKILIFLAMTALVVAIVKTGMKLEKVFSPQEAKAIQERLAILSKATLTLGVIAVFLAVALRYSSF